MRQREMERKGDGSIIQYLMNRLDYERRLKDSVGVVGLETQSSVVVGKRYVYKGLLSCHLKIAMLAAERGKPVVIWVEEDGSFYRFRPTQILAEGVEVEKGSKTLIDFSVRLGKPISVEEV